MKNRSIAAVLTAISILSGPAALLTTSPVAAQAPYVVRPATNASSADAHDLEGFVVSFDRPNMRLRARGFMVRVRLHPGTVLHPAGLTPRAGIVVNIHGFWQDGFFHANRIALMP
jgi:hypothetical protein